MRFKTALNYTISDEIIPSGRFESSVVYLMSDYSKCIRSGLVSIILRLINPAIKM